MARTQKGKKVVQAKGTGKGKSGAGSSRGRAEEAVPDPVRRRRSRAEMAKKKDQLWIDGLDGRGIRNERRVNRGTFRAGNPGIRAIIEKGLNFWFRELPGYHRATVVEFYRNMRIETLEDSTYPFVHDKIVSVISGSS